MKFQRIAQGIPSWKNALLAVVAGILLVLAFPDFELWFLAWFALVPLLIAVEREKRSTAASFICGWLFGFTFFTGSCWWLTYAPIHYAEFPVILAYSLLYCVTGIVAIFPGLFAAITSILLRHFGPWAYLAVPFVWVATEFGRYWITGNDWNAIGYSQAVFSPFVLPAQLGGILLVSFLVVAGSAIIAFVALNAVSTSGRSFAQSSAWILFLAVLWIPLQLATSVPYERNEDMRAASTVISIQPNVPMAGLDEQHWKLLRDRQIQLAQQAIDRSNEQRTTNDQPRSITVVLPESPMNYQWEEDPEFQKFISAFAAKNNVNVLFNSAEPDREHNKYFNSAVMIDASGREVAEYDKIYLLPFGEAVPTPLENILPGFVGNFSYGRNYSLVPLGQAKAGIMICFESHFGQLSREYVRRGADAIIEMTNDGYLGPTPVLRQHLANAVFRAVETNRPVLRVTNVGITAYITPRGEVLDPTQPYTEDTRVWSVARSDGSQTFYVKYGDWFAWLCSVVTALLLIVTFIEKRSAD